MPVVEGLGNCPLCAQKIEVGTPARYFKGSGHQAMAHTACITKHEAEVNTPAYKRRQVEEEVHRAKAALDAAKVRLKNAQLMLKALEDV